MINYGLVKNTRSYLRRLFEEAKPFPHLGFENFVKEGVCERVCREFETNKKWDVRKDEGVQVKTRSDWKNDDDIPNTTFELIRELNSGKFLRFLSSVTGIDGIIPDPYLTGGGFNVIRKGGCLAIHADGNWHDLMQVHRRLNVILFLNRDWNESWGGHLEFWNSKVENGEVIPTTLQTKISPTWNKMVIFKTTDFTMHGHPQPLNCPEDRERRSLILYYYTATRLKSEILKEEPHRAIFKGSWDYKNKKSSNTLIVSRGEDA